MPMKVPHVSVTVQRDGVNITPPIGKPFDFTKEEIASVKAHRWDGLRDPVNESAEIEADDEPDAVKLSTKLSSAKKPMQGGSPEDGKPKAKAKPGKALEAADAEEDDEDTL